MTTTAASTISTFTDFLLAELRVASVRARLMAAEAESIGSALRGGFVSVDAAVEWAADAGIVLASSA